MLDEIYDNTSVNQNAIGRNGINCTPSVDAVAEFKVKTNNYSAEFGRSSGAIISTTLRSGGNEFPGSVWNFLRNMPDRVEGVSLYMPDPGVDGWFNPAAFRDPGSVVSATGVPITRFGHSARRIGRGPRVTNLDFSLFKNFPITERMNLQFRAEAFNLSNTPAFSLRGATSPALTIGNASFGKLTSSSATGRQLQMGLKLLF